VADTGLSPDEQRRRVGVRREIVPGVLDAALSSLATFAMGFYAARALPPAALGGYALVFSAFMLMTKVPAQLLFKPAEIAAVSFREGQRLGLLSRTLRLGLAPAALSALAISFWVAVAPPGIPLDIIVALTCTAVLAAIVSPVQDHVRRMLHMADGSWAAVAVSTVQFVVAVLSLWFLVRSRIPAWWVPFTALALANTFSLAFGLLLAGTGRSPTVEADLEFWDLARSGRWLVVIGLMPLAAAFACGAIVSHLAGPAALGYAEAGRILGQPPFVVSTGLGAVLGPRSMEAAREGRFREARRVSRVYVVISLLCGLPYLALVGFAWHWNPVTRVLPNAYVIDGLVSATILGNLVIGMDWPYRSELLGVGRATTLARLEGTANVARIGVAGTALATGAFAIPAGLVTLALVRAVGYRVTLRALWRNHRRD
jgi:O-antigen/teichoic acid export membrane protein